MSGKTWLAKALASRVADKPGLVYDPNRSAHWPANWEKYSNPANFLKAARAFKSGFCFMDEAKTLWDHDTRAADQLLFRRRHDGIAFTVIAQRTRMVPPNARNQCAHVFAFRQQKDDADTLAQEYADGMRACATLEPGHFLASNGYTVRAFKLSFDSLPPTIVGLSD